MAAIDRRTLLRDILPGAVVVAVGVTTAGFVFMPKVADAVPLAMDKANALKVDGLAEKAQVVVVGPRRRRRRWRGGRRWVCWWRRGRRVCGWRW
jgi:hypothetical protein